MPFAFSYVPHTIFIMQLNIYSTLAFVSAIFLIALNFMVVKLRRTKGAQLFSFVILCFAIYSIGYGLVISAKSLPQAITFFFIERIGASFIPSFYILFALSYIENYDFLKKQFLPIYFVIPVLSAIILLTNSHHNLFYSNPRYSEGDLISAFAYSPKLWYYIQQFYILVGSFLANIVLIALFISGSRIYRRQIGSIVIGSFILLILHTLFHPSMLGLLRLNVNPTPFISVISGLLMYIGLKRYNLFRFMPIIRDSIFEKLSDGIIVIDKNQFLVDFNEMASIFIHLKKNQIGEQAENVLTFWHELKCHEFDKNEKQLIDFKTNISGVLAFYEISISPYYDDKIIFQGQIFVIRDITSLKESEKTIEGQRQLINAMLDNLPIGIFMVDAENGKPLLVNNYAKILMGRGIMPDATKENLSEVYEAFIAGTDQRYPTEKMPIARGMVGESSHIDDMEVRQPDGKRLQLEIVGCPIIDRNGKVYASLVGFFDITDRKRTEQFIKEQNKRLQELIATKDRFFSIIAHDLKSPFNTIIGFGELLKNRVDEFSKDEISEYSNHIYNAAIQTFKLLENLLEWSRIQQGTIKFQPSCQNLSLLCIECLKAFSESASIKEINLLHSVPENINVYVDKEMLSTIIRNLISNAIKFTPRKGKIELIAHHTSNNKVEVTVIDTGIGMDNEMKQNIFKIDGKVSRPGTEGEPSTGLGLLLCKEFAAKHGSEIEVESTEGSGSKFYFNLPKG